MGDDELQNGEVFSIGSISDFIKTPVPDSPKVGDLSVQVNCAICAGKEFLFSVQRKDLYWCAELESNPTITAEYVFMHQMLGEEFQKKISDKNEKIIRYLSQKQKEDGSWSIAQDWPGDVSTTAEVYLALRMMGMESSHSILTLATTFIRNSGGLEKIRIFTRVFFAMFGLVPWDTVPIIPPEFIFVPSQVPINIYSLASWARSTMVPLFILFHYRPVYSFQKESSLLGQGLDHLWLDPENKKKTFSSSLFDFLRENKVSWKSLFGLSDPLLRIYERTPVSNLREEALEKCTRWVLERQEGSGDWGGIFPPMLNGIIALNLRGYSLDSDPIKRGLRAIEKFSWEDSDGFRIQACVSPVWDTALATISLMDSNCNSEDERVQGAVQWLLNRQLLVGHGDWKVYRPELGPGGWSFEYHNSWYPDVDDTAAVILALLKQDPSSAYGQPVRRAVEWVLGMQNRDGGWAAFDVNNDKIFLNQIPFSDMDSLCDPSSPDVTGRVIESYGLLLQVLRRDEEQGAKKSQFPEDLKKKVRRACDRSVDYLWSTQESEGSWFGRWGVNYIYGTSNVLCGLIQLKVADPNSRIERAVQWLKQCQNQDGGWGESVASYSDKSQMGKGKSTPSQTAWALMGLLNYVSPYDPSIENGIRWLLANQKPADSFEFKMNLEKNGMAYEGGLPLPFAQGSSWLESQFTGTGFPNHFYLNYHYYRHYFPMMALGRYLNYLTN